MNLKIGNKNIENSACEKLLVGKVENKLKFIKNVDGIVFFFFDVTMNLTLYFLHFPLFKKNSFFALQFVAALSSGCVIVEPLITK